MQSDFVSAVETKDWIKLTNFVLDYDKSQYFVEPKPPMFYDYDDFELIKFFRLINYQPTEKFCRALAKFSENPGILRYSLSRLDNLQANELAHNVSSFNLFYLISNSVFKPDEENLLSYLQDYYRNYFLSCRGKPTNFTRLYIVIEEAVSSYGLSFYTKALNRIIFSVEMFSVIRHLFAQGAKLNVNLEEIGDKIIGCFDLKSLRPYLNVLCDYGILPLNEYDNFLESLL